MHTAPLTSSIARAIPQTLQMTRTSDIGWPVVLISGMCSKKGT